MAKTDTSGVHVWLVLWKAYEALHAYAMENISSLNMCMSDFAILEILLHKGTLPINEIGKRLALTSGTMTTAIDRLEERGFVVREDSQTDRRARLVKLTVEGKRLIARAFEKHAVWLEDVAAELSIKEREQTISLLKKFGFSAQAQLKKKRAK